MNESTELAEVRDFLTLKYPKLFPQRDVIWLPQGWLKLVSRLLDDIQDKLIAKKVTVAQVKEKFGQLRLYLDKEHQNNLVPDDAADIWAKIYEAEENSLSICQQCGSEDLVDKDNYNGCIKTLCIRCRDLDKIQSVK